MVEIEDIASSGYQMYILDKAGSLFEILPQDNRGIAES